MLYNIIRYGPLEFELRITNVAGAFKRFLLGCGSIQLPNGTNILTGSFLDLGPPNTRGGPSFIKGLDSLGSGMQSCGGRLEEGNQSEVRIKFDSPRSAEIYIKELHRSMEALSMIYREHEGDLNQGGIRLSIRGPNDSEQYLGR